MKKAILKILAILFPFSFMSMKSDPPTKIIFFGDSITELGVNKGGYIDLMKQSLEAQKLHTKYQLIGAGIGGNKIYDLYLRWEDDVLSQKPNVVVIYVGVNDVWHKQGIGTGTDADKFEKFYTALIKKMQAAGIQVVLCTPACIGERTDFSNQQDGDLNFYANIVRNLASKFDLRLCDMRKAALEYNLKNNPQNRESGILTYDRVHLTDAGNRLVADEMMKVLMK